MKSIVYEDSKFLMEHNIMDYSMLMIIENFVEGQSEQNMASINNTSTESGLKLKVNKDKSKRFISYNDPMG